GSRSCVQGIPGGRRAGALWGGAGDVGKWPRAFATDQTCTGAKAVLAPDAVLHAVAQRPPSVGRGEQPRESAALRSSVSRCSASGRRGRRLERRRLGLRTS